MIADGRPRTVTFATDLMGQVIKRDEQDNTTGGDPHEIWYRFGGRQQGYVGNNGTIDTTYAASIASRTAAPGTGAFFNGSSTSVASADFDLAHDQINSYAQGSRGGTYVIQAGDTLASIAAALWGDADLWYKLAEINGLTAESELIEGQPLLIPAGVQRNSNTADTYKPYDPLEVLGNLSPTAAAPPRGKKGCGGLGQVLLAVIAVVVTIATKGATTSFFTQMFTAASKGLGLSLSTATLTAAGAVAGGAAAAAAGSIASQGVGVATGIQDKFSWNAVALSAVGGGLGGVNGSAATWQQAATRAVTANVITQGIGVVTGLQDKFSWAGVAAAGVGAGVGFKVGQAVNATSLLSNPTAANFGANVARSGAQIIADAATRSLMEGTNFGDNVIAALPTALGTLIGEGLMGSAAARGASATADKTTHTAKQHFTGIYDPTLTWNSDPKNPVGLSLEDAERFNGRIMSLGENVEVGEDIVVSARRSSRAPLDGWWRGVDFTPDQHEVAPPSASEYFTPQPSSLMQNVLALGSYTQQLPTYEQVLARENSGGYSWEAGPTSLERWQQQQRIEGVARVVTMTQTPLGAGLSVGSRAFGASQQRQDGFLIAGMAAEGIVGGRMGAPALSSSSSPSMQAMRRSAVGRSSPRARSAVSPEEAYYIRVNPAYPGRPDPQFSIDTSTFVNPVSRNAARFPRDSVQFWNAWIEKNPGTFSASNLYRLQELGLSPRVDPTWLRSFPEHSAYRGDRLVHHHVGGGQYAVPVPYRTHRGSESIWHGN